MSADPINEYMHTGSMAESNWRSIILFGRNVASYKFALAKALFDLAKEDKDSATLEQLAVPYARHLCEHVAHSPKQATSRSSKFIDACAAFVDGRIGEDELIAVTVRLGFNNVLDAFHIVNQNEIPVRFFEKDFGHGSKRLILTDEVFKLAISSESSGIMQETESRWNLVETAWELGVNSNLLAYDAQSQLITVQNDFRRKDVTSVRGALNGYQKGRCFYCFSGIKAAPDSEGGSGCEIIFDTTPPRVEYSFIGFDSGMGESDDARVGVGLLHEERMSGGFDKRSTSDSRADDGLNAAADSNVLLGTEGNEGLCDVDHFFPHMLSRQMSDVNFDGVWNLVLSCQGCNRGEDGKFARIPDRRYLERLHRRNEYLIASHHPLRETLIAQTGANMRERWRFLDGVDRRASELLPGARWFTEQYETAVF